VLEEDYRHVSRYPTTRGDLGLHGAGRFLGQLSGIMKNDPKSKSASLADCTPASILRSADELEISIAGPKVPKAALVGSVFEVDSVGSQRGSP
jgi:hypothetical protein